MIRGGYFSNRSFVRGGVFLPSVGLTFEFGGARYPSWDSYHAFYAAHPDRFRAVYAGPAFRPRVFQGAGGHGYRADGYRAGDDRYNRDRANYRGGGHVFRGARGEYRRDR